MDFGDGFMSSIKKDVLIIGGGIAGLSVARELSKYDVDIMLVEKEDDVGKGTTSANMRLVCQGGDGLTFRPGTLHAELNVKSIPEWPRIVDELRIPFKRIGGLSLIRNAWDYSKALKSISRSFKNSLKPDASYYISENEFKYLQVIDKNTLYKMEPNLTGSFLGAVYDPNLAITSSVEVAKAYAENAKANGVDIMLKTMVESIDRDVHGFTVYTNRGDVEAKYVVNAAGIYADKIAEMARARTFSFVPIKGVMLILDKNAGSLVEHALVILPYMEEAPVTKAIVPMIEDTLLIGIHLEITVKGDLSYKDLDIEHLVSIGGEFLSDIELKNHIEDIVVGQMTFTNVETGWYEYIVDSPLRIPNWMNVVLGPAGVSASPALAKKVIWRLGMSGLTLNMKKDYDPGKREVLR